MKPCPLFSLQCWFGSNRTPQDAETSNLIGQTTEHHAETPRSIEWDYERCKSELMKKPQIRHIFDIMELNLLLLQQININIDKLNIESDQNQLIKQLIELIKMNVNLLIHERDRLQTTIKLNKEHDEFLATSHTTQASTQYDLDPVLKNIKDLYEKLEKAKANVGQVGFDLPLIEDFRKLIFQAEHKLASAKKMKEIYDLLENAKAEANAGQVEFGPNLIKDIRRFILQCNEGDQAEHQHAPSGSSIDPNGLNNDLAELIVNILPIELRPASAESNLDLVMWNVKLINKKLLSLKQKPQTYSQRTLTDNLIELTGNLISQINQISRVDWRVSNLPHDSNCEVMKLHTARIIQLMCSTPKPELYIIQLRSFKDICNQVAAIHHYRHQQINTEKSESERRIEKNYTWCGSFYMDIFNGNCEGVQNFLEANPLALTAKITVDGNTALHIAVKAMKEEIVEKLLRKLMEENKLEENLKTQNKEGKTPLYIAASSGGKPIIEKLVETYKDTLLIKDIWLIECEDETNHTLPLFVAAKYGNKAMVKYIYDKMPKYKENESLGEHQKAECFPRENPNDGKAKLWMRYWALFLANLIYNDDYDMALQIMNDYPSLALSKHTDVETPLFVLAQRPSLGANLTFHGKASKFQCPTFICGNKMDDGTASKASKLLDKIILTINDLESHKLALSAALFKAAEVGSVEFVAMFINSLPIVLSWLNDLHQNIFHVAIINRQENIFNLIYRLGSVKNQLTGLADKSNNWMLHLAGEMAPTYRLNQVPGPAMQLQRELQWFQAVKEIVPNISIEVKNLVNMTPHELFADKHKVLMKEGENWMRNTASSCSIVAALITTVMFAAAFTVPGGNDPNTGNPLFLREISFLLFAVSDLVALSTSCASVLIFLSILTSRFAQEDFLTSLPRRLIWGLVLLFVSMAAMVFAFCDAIFIIIQYKYQWFCIPIMVLVGFIPVFTFLWLMFPLLINLWRATNTSIFNKSSRVLYH